MIKALVILATVIVFAQCFMFDLDARTFKCFKEELPNNFDVYGEFEAYAGAMQVIDFRVRTLSFTYCATIMPTLATKKTYWN